MKLTTDGKLAPRERMALAVLAAAVAIWALLQFVILPDSSAPATQVVSLNSTQLRQKVAQLRQIAAALPVREALIKQTDADLADRERGIIQAGTAAEAQAQLVLTAQRLGKANDLDVRGSDSPAPKAFGEYGIVYANISFDCHVEQLLNFLADLTREQELIVPSEERITSGNPKEKTMSVRMLLAGVVAKKLIPEKKGLGAF
jgi:hypothetical protein